MTDKSLNVGWGSRARFGYRMALGSSSVPVSGMAGVVGMDIVGPVVVEAGPPYPG